MLLHQRQVLIVELAGAPVAARLEKGSCHGAGGGKTHPAALTVGAVVLAHEGNGQLDQAAMGGFCRFRSVPAWGCG